MIAFIETVRIGLARRWHFTRIWFLDGAPLWLWLGVAGMLFAIPYLFPADYFQVAADTSDRVRWSGMLFQFAGLATVVWGLNRSRQLFDRESLWKAIGQWLGQARYIVKPPRPVNAKGRSHVSGVGTASATGLSSSVSAGNSLEDRVQRLEENVKRLGHRVSDTNQTVRKLRDETNKRLDHERAERIAGNRNISGQLETATIGGIHLEVAGLAYLFLGIAMTAVPDEVAWLLLRIGF